MKPPLTVEGALHETGRSFLLRDTAGRAVAQYLREHDAKLIAVLVNRDYAELRRGLPDMSEMADVDYQGSINEE